MRTEVGHFAPTGSTQQMPCSPGTVAPNVSMGACTKCEAGTFQAEPGQLVCWPCKPPPGSYCAEGAADAAGLQEKLTAAEAQAEKLRKAATHWKAKATKAAEEVAAAKAAAPAPEEAAASAERVTALEAELATEREGRAAVEPALLGPALLGRWPALATWRRAQSGPRGPAGASAVSVLYASDSIR